MTGETAKSGTRQAAFARRKVAHGQGLDRAARAHLAAWLAPFRGLALAGYMPIRSEIDPLAVMADMAAHGPVCVPVVEADEQPLRFARWRPGAAMTKGAFGALVPAKTEFVTPDVLIVPLVAFDARGGRLGYGGGFYDRTLQALRAARPTRAVGFAYSAQQAETLPLERTDQPLDAIVTETGIHTF